MLRLGLSETGDQLLPCLMIPPRCVKSLKLANGGGEKVRHVSVVIGERSASCPTHTTASIIRCLRALEATSRASIADRRFRALR